MKIIDYSMLSSRAWERFIKDVKGGPKISRYFHLRPTNSGVTLISTLSNYEMRGIKGLKKEDQIIDILKRINESYGVLTSLDDKRKNELMAKLGFKQRGEAKDRKLEEKIQATMINTMSKDRNLKSVLGTKNCIKFIASELIYESGKYRIDIVGYDGRNIYLFELKKNRTTKIDQVRDYVAYYSKKEKNDVLRKILKNYPINPVDAFREIIGVMVMEHAENSPAFTDWKSLAKDNRVNVIFYKPSLIYEKVE